MFKILIILGITLYILSKIGGFFFKIGAASQQRQYQQRKPNDGSIHVDSAPKKDKKSSTIKGGDYIDYEEVK
jgi:hypothetical protein